MLLGNGSVLHKLPLRYLAGSGASVEPQLRHCYSMSGMARNRMYQDMASAALNLQAVPPGTYAGIAWQLPQKAGAMAAINSAFVTVSATARGAMGINVAGSASMAIAVSPAHGSLIVSANGSATMTFAATGNAFAVLNASGSASVAITATASISALGFMRGGANLAVSGSLVAYATGNMIGSTIDTSVLTADAISQAVWNALAADFVTTGTMGAKLNSAASGGVDYASMAEAVRTELQTELTRIGDLAKIHGLVIGSDLVVTATSRVAGDIEQTITDTGISTTVSRA